MTKRDVFSVSCKILGLVCIVYALLYIPLFSVMTPRAFFWLPIASPILLLCLAFFLIRFGDTLAEKLIQVDIEIPKGDNNNWEKSVFALATRIIGLVCLTKGVPDLVRALTQYSIQTRNYQTLSPQEWGNIIGAIVFLLIGGYLISGGKRLIEFAYKGKAEPIPLGENNG